MNAIVLEPRIKTNFFCLLNGRKYHAKATTRCLYPYILFMVAKRIKPT